MTRGNTFCRIHRERESIIEEPDEVEWIGFGSAMAEMIYSLQRESSRMF
jgi:hypothetical protein